MARKLLPALTLALVILPSACSMKTTAELPEKIKSEISRLNPPLKDYSLDVVARSQGVVELAGYVASESDKARLIQVAKRVEGVSTINEKVSVKSAPQSNEATGSKFQGVILDKLENELVGAQYIVSIVEKGGDVVVQGSTDSLLTKARVLEVVKGVVGNQGRVVDELKQTAAPSDRWIEEQVSSELQKRFPAWRGKISVATVRNGVVTLTGTLGDHWDIDSVLAAVVMVPGVKDLRSEITINGEPYSSGGVRKSAQ